MKIVKFKDGTYGIRKLSLFGYKYLDIHYWYYRLDRYFCDCKITLEKAVQKMDLLEDKGTIVSPTEETN